MPKKATYVKRKIYNAKTGKVKTYGQWTHLPKVSNPFKTAYATKKRIAKRSTRRA